MGTVFIGIDAQGGASARQVPLPRHAGDDPRARGPDRARPGAAHAARAAARSHASIRETWHRGRSVARERARRLRLFVAVFRRPRSSAPRFAQDALRRPDDRVSWVKLENLHYTMRFIGEVGEDGARRVAAAADEAASDVAAFEAVLGGLGAFPNARRARAVGVAHRGRRAAEGAGAIARGSARPPRLRPRRPPLRRT